MSGGKHLSIEAICNGALLLIKRDPAQFNNCVLHRRQPHPLKAEPSLRIVEA